MQKQLITKILSSLLQEKFALTFKKFTEADDLRKN